MSYLEENLEIIEMDQDFNIEERGERGESGEKKREIFLSQESHDRNFKKQRINEIDLNDSIVLGTINEYPYIYRSIQAIAYMKKYPLVLRPGLTNFEYIKHVQNYIWSILNMFFSGCNLSYAIEEQSLDDKIMNIMIETPVNELEMEKNFGLFLSFIRGNIWNAFYKIKCHWYSGRFNCEGNYLYINVKMKTDDTNDYCDDEYKYYEMYIGLKYEKREDNIDI